MVFVLFVFCSSPAPSVGCCLYFRFIYNSSSSILLSAQLQLNLHCLLPYFVLSFRIIFSFFFMFLFLAIHFRISILLFIYHYPVIPLFLLRLVVFYSSTLKVANSRFSYSSSWRSCFHFSRQAIFKYLDIWPVQYSLYSSSFFTFLTILLDFQIIVKETKNLFSIFHFWVMRLLYLQMRFLHLH